MYLRKLLFILLLSLFSLFVLGYGIYKAMPIIIGPEIVLTQPNSDTVEGTSVQISGNVSRTKTLFINDIATSFTESGNFESRLAIYPGSNILTIKAVDRFGRVKTISKNLSTE